MKLFAKIIKAILIIALTLTITAFITVSILFSTILNESYILKRLQSSNYYSNIYNEVQSTFENYIGPSGIDENILTEICTIEDIQNDTEIILGNIYEGTEKQIDTASLKKKIIQKVNENIENNTISKSQEKNIEDFAQTISEEYKNTISHTEYEKQINNAYSKGVKILNICKTALCVCIVVILLMLVLLNLKQLYRAIADVGIAVISSGLVYVIFNIFVNSNIKVQNIKILNSSISIVLQNIITDVLSKVINIGLTAVAAGMVLIVIGNIIQTKNTEE